MRMRLKLISNEKIGHTESHDEVHGKPAQKTYTVELQKRNESCLLSVVLYVYLPLAAAYLIWRATLINWHIWYGPVLYTAELYGIVTTALFLAVTHKVYLPVHRPLNEDMLAKKVDVLIPTYNEPISVLEPVVKAALNIRGVRNVLVLDDGNRTRVKVMTENLCAQYHPRLTNEHAKAGNMNNGLAQTDAEFIICLDADHIPQPDFIEQSLGFFEDEKLALVQSPQTFYNTTSFLFRRWHGQRDGWSEQKMFYDCIQPAKNRFNSAFFVGTSAILRRSALESVGNFATGTATEDIHTSLRLHAKGWKSLFLARPLAYGLEAESLREFYKQRKRWAAGSLGLLFRSPDSPLRARGLSLMQRLNYLSATLAHLQGVQKLCFFVIPILTMLWGVSPLRGSPVFYSACFSVFFLISIASTWLYSRGTYHPLYNEAYSLANMMAHFGGIKGIIKVQKKFAVSRKITARKERTWLTKILWSMFWIDVLAVGRVAWLYGIDQKHYALLVYSFIFMTINMGILLSFVLYLRAYERQDQAAPERVALPEILERYRKLSPALK